MKKNLIAIIALTAALAASTSAFADTLLINLTYYVLNAEIQIIYNVLQIKPPNY